MNERATEIERLKQRIAQLEARIEESRNIHRGIEESEARYRTLIDFLPIGLVVHDGKKILYVNKWAISQLGLLSADQIIGQPLRNFVHPDSWDIVNERIRRLMEEHKGAGLFHERFLKPDGTPFHVEVAAIPITFNQQDAVLVAVRDVDEQVKIHRELVQQKERLAVTLSSIGDGVIATDANGTVTLLNKVAEDLTGWTQAEAVGRDLNEVFHIVNEKTRKPVQNPVEKVLSMGKIVGLANGTMLIARDGREYIIADSGAPIKDAQGAIVGVVMVFRDVTQKRRWEEERRRLQSFETLELMAGGIAHDFNNLLTGVLGHLSLLAYELPEDFAGIKHVEDAQRSVLIARDLVTHLSLIAKGSAPVRENAPIADVIKASSELSAAGSNVQIEVDIAKDLWPVVCDTNQISQAIQNIVINAVQAMPAGGRVVIRAENNMVLERDNIPLPPGKYVKISVTDQGVGIHPKYIDKVFDPYFTTKQKGSGLGLSIVYSVVTRHNGHVDIQSRLGSGTRVTIWLPAGEQDTEKPLKRAKESHLVESGGRVLVVDDETVVRDVCIKMLNHLGYEAEAANDSTTAIAMVNKALEEDKPFDIAIIDLTMPGDMGGKQLCNLLHEQFPDLAVIASSGYPDAPAMLEPARFGFVGTLKKPYTIQELKLALAKAANKHLQK